MAKKKVAESGGNKFSFSDLAKKLNVINVDGGILSENSDSIKIDDWISTGNYMLNAQISGSIFKGIPGNRVTVISGESGVGKTFFCLNIAREAQNKGYKILWIDTEAAVDPTTFERFGIDLDNVLHLPIDTINNVSTYISNMVDSLLEAKTAGKELDKYLIILDSLGNLSTDKEVNDVKSGSDKADMTRPKEIKRLFRICTRKLGQMKIPMVITNHVYDSMSMYGGKVQSGGSGILYNASNILMLSKAQLKENGQDAPKTGIVATSNMFKSRFTKSNIPVKVHISFYKGMNPFVGLEEFIDWDLCGIDYGKIEKNEFVPSGTGRTIAVKHLGKHLPAKQLFTPTVFTQEVLEALEPSIRQHFELPPTGQMDYDVSELVGDDSDEAED